MGGDTWSSHNREISLTLRLTFRSMKPPARSSSLKFRALLILVDMAFLCSDMKENAINFQRGLAIEDLKA